MNWLKISYGLETYRPIRVFEVLWEHLVAGSNPIDPISYSSKSQLIIYLTLKE